MPEPDHNSAVASSPCDAPEDIEQWKASVHDFFSREWDNLRELICRLDEQDWNGAKLEAPEEQTLQPFREQVFQQITAPATTRAPEPPVAQPIVNVESNRLADLAKRLEDRLKKKPDNA